jgi:hypothetical protein
MQHPCRSHRPDDPCPSAVHEVEDAFAVLTAVEMTYPDARAFALVMDQDRRGQLAIPVEGEAPPDEGIEALAGVLADAFAEGRQGRAVVILASKRASVGFSTDDAGCWQRLRERSRSATFELLDWILLGEGDFRSMSETCGPGWPPPPDAT